MNTQKDMLNKKYLMITALIWLTIISLPHLVNQMFAGANIYPRESVVIELKVPEVFVSTKEEREIPVVIQFVDEAAVEIELVDESDMFEAEAKKVTAHIWIDAWKTYIFGHWERGREVIVTANSGISCIATIDENKSYTCPIEWWETLSKKDIHAVYTDV